jgi:hypothetical protein
MVIAEWLERSNMDETITAGDIVAVGGKITKRFNQCRTSNGSVSPTNCFRDVL